jgi:hypothetical protein
MHSFYAILRAIGIGSSRRIMKYSFALPTNPNRCWCWRRLKCSDGFTTSINTTLHRRVSRCPLGIIMKQLLRLPPCHRNRPHCGLHRGDEVSFQNRDRLVRHCVPFRGQGDSHRNRFIGLAVGQGDIGENNVSNANRAHLRLP